MEGCSEGGVDAKSVLGVEVLPAGPLKEGDVTTLQHPTIQEHLVELGVGVMEAKQDAFLRPGQEVPNLELVGNVHQHLAAPDSDVLQVGLDACEPFQWGLAGSPALEPVVDVGSCGHSIRPELDVKAGVGEHSTDQGVQPLDHTLGMPGLLMEVRGGLLVDDSEGQDEVLQFLGPELLGVVRAQGGHTGLGSSHEVLEAQEDQLRYQVSGLEGAGVSRIGVLIHEDKVVALPIATVDVMGSSNIKVDKLQGFSHLVRAVAVGATVHLGKATAYTAGCMGSVAQDRLQLGRGEWESINNPHGYHVANSLEADVAKPPMEEIKSFHICIREHDEGHSTVFCFSLPVFIRVDRHMTRDVGILDGQQCASKGSKLVPCHKGSQVLLFLSPW
jgi:hypothetical protein